MRDFVEVLKQVESLYPSSAGGTSKDEALRASLVLYTNSLFKEIEREQQRLDTLRLQDSQLTAELQTERVEGGTGPLQPVVEDPGLVPLPAELEG